MATIMDHPHTVDMGIIIEVVMEVITRISLRDKIEEAIEVEEAVEAAEDAVIAAAIDNDLIRHLGFNILRHISSQSENSNRTYTTDL